MIMEARNAYCHIVSWHTHQTWVTAGELPRAEGAPKCGSEPLVAPSPVQTSYSAHKSREWNSGLEVSHSAGTSNSGNTTHNKVGHRNRWRVSPKGARRAAERGSMEFDCARIDDVCTTTLWESALNQSDPVTYGATVHSTNKRWRKCAHKWTSL